MTAVARTNGDAVTTAPAHQALAPQDLSPEQVALIKATVAKGASNDELSLFLHLARTYGLDPFAKEIWCIKYGNSPATIFTSRDGYLKIANGHPAFAGLISDVVRANDHFQVKPGSVEHSYAKGDRGAIMGAYALVFRKDREFPAYVFAPFDEYYAPQNGTWKKYPSAMILKVAESMALKRGFSISGLVTREELDASRKDDEERPEPRGRRAPTEFPGASLYGGTEPDPAAEVEDAEVIEERGAPGPTPIERTLSEREAAIAAVKAAAKEHGLNNWGLQHTLAVRGVAGLEEIPTAHLEGMAAMLGLEGATASANREGYVSGAIAAIRAASPDQVAAVGADWMAKAERQAGGDPGHLNAMLERIEGAIQAREQAEATPA